MSKLLFFLLLVPCLFAHDAAYSQPKENDSLRQEYLRKWKNQRTAGWIFLGSGIALVSIGLVVTSAEVVTTTFTSESSGVGPTLVLIGVAAGVTSIPFFISASSKRRKAADLSLVPESIRLPQMTSGNRKFAALKLTIPL